MTIAELNRCSQREFIAALARVFEASPWVAERAWARRPFAAREDLHQAMVDEVEVATRDEQRALLCAHPDLGARTAMSEASVGEQASAGLDRLTPDEQRQLKELTEEYRRRFGFPFVLAVKGRTRHDILAALARRVRHSENAEWREALNQVAHIAAFRLHDVVD